jgi:site-specific recombinase XerC
MGVRDVAILSLLYSCGLRRAELVALDVDRYI